MINIYNNIGLYLYYLWPVSSELKLNNLVSLNLFISYLNKYLLRTYYKLDIMLNTWYIISNESYFMLSEVSKEMVEMEK